MSSGAGSARTRSSATPESRRQVKVELGGGVRGVRPQTVLGEVGRPARPPTLTRSPTPCFCAEGMEPCDDTQLRELSGQSWPPSSKKAAGYRRRGVYLPRSAPAGRPAGGAKRPISGRRYRNGITLGGCRRSRAIRCSCLGPDVPHPLRCGGGSCLIERVSCRHRSLDGNSRPSEQLVLQVERGCHCRVRRGLAEGRRPSSCSAVPSSE